MRTWIAFAIALFPALAWGQLAEPATWQYEYSVKEAQVGDEIEVIFNIDIEDGWYMYSNDFDPDLGPMLTETTFLDPAGYELVGGLVPQHPKKKYDEVWEGDVTYFTKKAQFRQKIKILSTDFAGVSGEYTGQVCTEIDGQCIPFFGDFTLAGITVTGEPAPTPQPEPENLSPNVTEVPKPESSTPAETEPTSVPETNESPLGNAITSIPAEESAPVDEVPAETSEPSVSLAQGDVGRRVVDTQEGRPVVEMDTFLTSEDQGKEKVDYWGFMIIAFLAGLTALLTPCVFPMIPLTVSFFTNKGKKGYALFYGFSIIFIYVMFGVILAPFMTPSTANSLSTDWLPNMIFFTVFLVFALSFFGLFEINLPTGMVNRMDKQGDRKGLIGVFFMAFTLVLVSFSCTGPIVGTILVEAAGGQRLKPILGMLAFSSAFAIPFTLFAFFPGLLKNLPKSGGWLNSVKVVLGFVELALAFKFFSIADLAYGWGLLDREINLAIWITIFALLGFYLLGKLRLPGDSKLETISVFRLVMSIFCFTFVVYLIPGMFGAPLKAMAGLLPPTTTHDFDLAALIRGEETSQSGLYAQEGCEDPLYADILHFPHGLQGYFNYEQALACARAQGKPLFIDFTGHGCVNCRKMEDNVWSERPVMERLKEEFVVLAMYVDDKTTLEEDQWYISAYDNRLKRTLGLQNMDVELQRANNNAQPYYLILDHEEKVLIDPIGYTPDVNEFVEYLDAGHSAFRTGQMDKLAQAQ
ncbi:MAG TPA: disulfide bond formation protein DsbD [Cytophagales bacterium]|nr:disulfide bond formation protein DsbD [Cytophagales bacterium]HAA18313.1 disulfide bond formation protein DsbD [Cytophagales bacterium]HAP63867.1 disulfide bond formation protein DsbD [Cytophagales bacterium]